MHNTTVHLLWQHTYTDSDLTNEIQQRIKLASSAFGRLAHRVFFNCCPVAVYTAICLFILLYGCDRWIPYRRHIKALEAQLLSLTYKVLTTSQPDYLHNLISVQSSGRTRFSSVVTLARPSVSSSLQITNRSSRYASPHLWNQLPSSFRQPHCVHSSPGSPHPTHIASSQSSPSFSHLSLPRAFTPDLKLISFTNPFLHSHSYSFRTDFTVLNLYCIKGALALFVLVSFSGYVC